MCFGEVIWQVKYNSLPEVFPAFVFIHFARFYCSVLCALDLQQLMYDFKKE